MLIRAMGPNIILSYIYLRKNPTPKMTRIAPTIEATVVPIFNSIPPLAAGLGFSGGNSLIAVDASVIGFTAAGGGVCGLGAV